MELHCPYSQYAADTVHGVKPGYRDRDTYVARSSVHGYGLFAARKLPKGFITGSYGGQRLTLAAADVEEDLGNAYLFDVKDAAGTVVQVVDGRDLATASKLRYINAPAADAQANSAWLQHDGNIFLQLTEDVPKGAEITAWYGDGTEVLTTRKKRAAPPTTTRWLHSVVDQPTRAHMLRLEVERRALDTQVQDLKYELDGHRGRTAGVDTGCAPAGGHADAAALAEQATRLENAESSAAELARQVEQGTARASHAEEQLREVACAGEAARKQAEASTIALRLQLRNAQDAAATAQQQLRTLSASHAAAESRVGELERQLGDPRQRCCVEAASLGSAEVVGSLGSRTTRQRCSLQGSAATGAQPDAAPDATRHSAPALQPAASSAAGPSGAAPPLHAPSAAAAAVPAGTAGGTAAGPSQPAQLAASATPQAPGPLAAGEAASPAAKRRGRPPGPKALEKNRLAELARQQVAALAALPPDAAFAELLAAVTALPPNAAEAALAAAMTATVPTAPEAAAAGAAPAVAGAAAGAAVPLNAAAMPGGVLAGAAPPPAPVVQQQQQQQATSRPTKRAAQPAGAAPALAAAAAQPGAPAAAPSASRPPAAQPADPHAAALAKAQAEVEVLEAVLGGRMDYPKGPGRKPGRETMQKRLAAAQAAVRAAGGAPGLSSPPAPGPHAEPAPAGADRQQAAGPAPQAGHPMDGVS